MAYILYLAVPSGGTSGSAPVLAARAFIVRGQPS
jgi:hypothetical protein